MPESKQKVTEDVSLTPNGRNFYNVGRFPLNLNPLIPSSLLNQFDLGVVFVVVCPFFLRQIVKIMG